MSSEYFLFTDGACRGNPGKSGGGAVLFDADMKEIDCRSEYFGIKTNNESEYNAIIIGLKMCIDRAIPFSKVNVRADSMLAVNHLTGIWRARHPNIVPLFQKVNNMGIAKCKSIQHVYRRYNTRADELANQAVDNMV
jgi:ribonuclease HI